MLWAYGGWMEMTGVGDDGNDLIASFDRSERRSRRNEYKRLALTFTELFILFMISAALPHPWQWSFYIAMLAYMVWGFWVMRPGSCMYCGQRSAMNVPKDSWKPRAWWDPRPPARRDMLCVCPADIVLYMEQHISEKLGPEMSKQFFRMRDGEPPQGPADR